MPKVKESKQQQISKEVSTRLKTALIVGDMDNKKFAKLICASISTVCTRKRNPETLTLGEIWAIEKASGCSLTIPFTRKETTIDVS